MAFDAFLGSYYCIKNWMSGTRREILRLALDRDLVVL